MVLWSRRDWRKLRHKGPWEGLGSLCKAFLGSGRETHFVIVRNPGPSVASDYGIWRSKYRSRVL